MLKNILISLIIMVSPCAYAQISVTHDELPNTNSTDSTAVLNNTLRQNANAINSIGGYFNSNQALSTANGGTGTNIGAFPDGALLVFDLPDNEVAYIAQGTAGQVLTSNGANFTPSFQAAGSHTQIFISSGTFVAPAGITTAYVSEVGGGGSGGAGTGLAAHNGTGGGGGQSIVNFPFTVTPGSSYTVTIGAGGAAVSTGVGPVDTNGNPGGNTSFSTLVASGGGGGTGHTTPGSGGGLTLDASGTTAGGFGVKGGNGGADSGGPGAGGGTLFGAGSNGIVNTGTGGTGVSNGTSQAGQSGIGIVSY